LNQPWHGAEPAPLPRIRARQGEPGNQIGESGVSFQRPHGPIRAPGKRMRRKPYDSNPAWLTTRRSVLATAIATALVLTARTGATQAVNVDRAGVALNGYDPVAYFIDGHPTPGTAAFTATWESARYRFASAANRDAFVTDPAHYLPTYGGYCAYGLAHGHKVKIDPEAWRIVDGKLYLNYSQGVQRRWLADIPGNIAAADRNWLGLKDKPHD
jgi:hypothetical protein